jgi:hypothetical protein
MDKAYRKLMVQHGGYVPFSALGDTKLKRTKQLVKRSKQLVKRTKQLVKRSKQAKRSKQKQPLFIRNSKNYATGTIIRNNDVLLQLSSNKRWTPIS